jgi:FkbM family methyltransferase
LSEERAARGAPAIGEGEGATTMKLLSWMPPSMATFIYTVCLKPKPLRAMAQWMVKRIIPSRLTVDGVALVMNRDDAVVCGALTLGCYENFPRQLFRRLLKPGMTVVDVGANIGLYTALAASTVGPAGRVIAVEPERRNADLIRETLALNHFTNVDVIQAAISDTTGAGQLFLNEENKADHRIFDRAASRAAVPVEFYRLDDLLTRMTVGRVDVIKVDIQGAEARALQGMRRTLTDNADIRVMIEYWPWGIAQAGGDPRSVLRLIRSLGLQVYEIDDSATRHRPESDDDRMAGLALERQHLNLLLQRSRDIPSLAP